MSLSATRLGREFGLTPQEMNYLLKEEGFLGGSPGNYYLTEKGRKYASERYDSNGYGGYAARGWSWFEWDESIIEKLNITSVRKREIQEKTSEQRRLRREEKEAQSEAYWKNVNNMNQKSAPIQSTKATENRSKGNADSVWEHLLALGINKLLDYFFK